MSFDNDLGMRNDFKDKDIAHNFGYFDISTGNFVSTNFTGSGNTIPADELATTTGSVDVSGAAPPVAGEVLTAVTPTTAAWSAPPGATTMFVCWDEQTVGTNGGTFTAGVWQTRVLNMSAGNTGGASLAANQFTLPSGTYRIRAVAPAYNVNFHKLRLRNITDATTDIEGVSAEAASVVNVQLDAHTVAVIEGYITIAASKTFELQHQCSFTQLSTGFGVAAGFGPEVYATVSCVKIL